MIRCVWLASASRRRAALDAGLAVFALVLPLAAILRPVLALGLIQAGIPESESRWPVLGIGLVYPGYFGALVAHLAGAAWAALTLAVFNSLQ